MYDLKLIKQQTALNIYFNIFVSNANHMYKKLFFAGLFSQVFLNHRQLIE